MRIALDVERAPMVERTCTARSAQYSSQDVTAEHVSDLHVDEMGRVNAQARR